MKTKILILFIVTILTISCFGGEVENSQSSPEGGDDGLLGDPQSSPEGVARAWLEAAAAGDCKTADGYVIPPNRKWVAEKFCGDGAFDQIFSARVDDAMVREIDMPGRKKVTFVGEITFAGTLNFRVLSDDVWHIIVENIEGRWYVADFWF